MSLKSTEGKSSLPSKQKGEQSKPRSQAQRPKAESPNSQSTQRAKGRGCAVEKTSSMFDGATLRELEVLVRQWAMDRGIYEHSTSLAQFMKMISETGELADALMRAGRTDNRGSVTFSPQRDAVTDAIGDILVCLINVAYLEGLSLQHCLQFAWEQIRERKGKMLPSGVFQKEGQ